MTVPDMSLSVRDLLLAHTRGVSLDVVERQEQFFDMEVPVITDLTDMEEFNRNLAEWRKRVDQEAKAEIDAKIQERKERANQQLAENQQNRQKTQLPNNQQLNTENT